MEENRPPKQQYDCHQTQPASEPGSNEQNLDDKNIDDRELLQRFARGDQDAQHTLIERHGRYLFGVAHALSQNAEDAEDLVQETLLASLRTKFRGESSLRTWLVKILMRQAAMLRRSKGRRPTMRLDAALNAAEEQSPTVAGSSGAEAKMDLSVMLAALSPEHRQVILLREVQQMSYEQMAESLGVPRGTVESRLHRAREELRKRFKNYLP